MTITYTEVSSQRHVALLPSAARTATPNQFQVTFTQDVDYIVLVVNATVVNASGSVTPKIEGVDPDTGATYTMLAATSTSVVNNTNGAKTYAYRVGPSLASGDFSANDIVPAIVRITFTHADSNSFTYSATLLAPV